MADLGNYFERGVSTLRMTMMHASVSMPRLAGLGGVSGWLCGQCARSAADFYNGGRALITFLALVPHQRSYIVIVNTLYFV